MALIFDNEAPLETDRISIPHEPGQWMIFRPLSWSTLAEAREAVVARAQRRTQNMSDDVVRQLIREDRDEAKKRAAAKKGAADAAPEVDDDEQLTWRDYDQMALLTNGIAAWSYERKGEPVRLYDQNIKRLDKRTAAWAAEQIHARSDQDTRADRGNADTPSTAH